jgi:histidyl-tRNA synthetase
VSEKFQAPSGTKDVLPGDALWWRLLGEIEALVPTYGFGRIQTPGFEDTALIHRSAGAGSDIVQKETYTFEDRGGRSLTLRPEGTAPIVRAYLENGLHREPKPVKLYTIAPMYRFDRPQAGRYREHTQLSAEVIGSADPAVDAELIQLYAELLRRFDYSSWELQLNSIGDEVCRPAYLARLNAWLDAHDDVLDESARQKRATTPLRVFDVKNERLQEALEDAPKIGESLCEACAEHFDHVKRYLDLYGIPYRVVPTLVRGIDYYTRTTFEFKETSTGHAQDTICAGGRYDGLVEQIGGEPTPAIGFGAGLERLVLALADAGATAEPRRLDVFVVTIEKEPVLPLVAELRRRGVAVDLDYAGRSQNAQVKHALRLDARRIVVVEDGEATVRERGAEDVRVPLGELVARLSAS